MNELWTLLDADHRAIWAMVNQLTGCADPTSAKQLAKQLVRDQSAHEWAEETVLWPVVRLRCGDGDALLDNLITQERQLKLALHDLGHLSPKSEEFTECLHTVAAHERTHLSYEENQVWPRLFDELTDVEIADVHRSWRTTRRRMPIRPHPHLRTNPTVLRFALPAVAALDRFSSGRAGDSSR